MSTVTKAARKSLLWLLTIIVALGGGVAYEALVNGHKWVPELGLDLAGGTIIVLQAQTTDGSPVTQDSLQQTVEIIRQRVNAQGVSEATIATENPNHIVVSLPGNPSDATIALVKQSAQMQFRPVLFTDDGSTTTFPDLQDTDPNLVGTSSSYASITEADKAEFLALDCTNTADLKVGDVGQSDAAFVTCGTDADRPTERYLLGPVELQGTDVSNATAGPEYNSVGAVIPNSFQVNLTFDGQGTDKFGTVTTRLVNAAAPRNRFAIVLDGLVITAPTVQSAINNGQAKISGNFTTIESATTIANQIKFGALPLTMTTLSQSKTTPTLGAAQLKGGLIAGGIGLLLVVLYSLVQYRALGFVTVASLAIAGTITYGSIDYLSGLIGYRLSLAGVAGIIVSIGVTADSFIVYFERVRDELREGRTLPASVEHGWGRARRTILASDSVSFLAATVLYLTAVGNVRGFAFTLGLTTIVDLIVVMLFTHPMLALLARTKFFGQGHTLSGLDPRQLGRESFYKGRGRVAVADMTLAERKAAALKAGSTSPKGEG